MKLYDFELKHDDGYTLISTSGSSLKAAKEKIIIAESCPESSITYIGTIHIKEQKFEDGTKGYGGVYSHNQGVFVVPVIPDQSKDFVKERIRLFRKGKRNCISI